MIAKKSVWATPPPIIYNKNKKTLFVELQIHIHNNILSLTTSSNVGNFPQGESEPALVAVYVMCTLIIKL